MLLKHKNMKDVAALVVKWPRGFSRDEPCLVTVWWVNLNKHVDTGKPFICSPRPEDIWVRNSRDWEEIEGLDF